MTLDDSRAAELYAEADRLAAQWAENPANVAHRRFEGSRHVNWRIGPHLVRVPRERQPPLVSRVTLREADVLRLLSGSGVTAELLHDGGARHIQEFLPGKDLAVDGPGWREWQGRAAAEIPDVFVKIARAGADLWEPQSATQGWEADRRRIVASWAESATLRESLFAELDLPLPAFHAAVNRPLVGDRPQVGTHNDPKIQNFLLTESGIKVVDVELFGPGDAARDLGRHLLGSPYSAEKGTEIAEETQAGFAREIPAAADGMAQDAELFRAAYGAAQVMGTLTQRLTRLEEDVAGMSPRARSTLDGRLLDVAEDIREWTSSVLESFGRDPWDRDRLASAIGQWVIYDHPQAPGRPAPAPRRDNARKQTPTRVVKSPDLPAIPQIGPEVSSLVHHKGGSVAKTASPGLSRMRPNTSGPEVGRALGAVSAFGEKGVLAATAHNTLGTGAAVNSGPPRTSSTVRKTGNPAAGLSKKSALEL